MSDQQDLAKLTSILDDMLDIDISYQDSQKHYQAWALEGSYDELYDENVYGAPSACARAVRKLFREPQFALVMDIGAGTGILGELMRKDGFMKIHALEPCKEFVAIAEKKSIYDRIIEEFIGNGSVVSCKDDTYDAVVASGGYAPGHIPHDAPLEILRILKPGGYYVNCMRQVYLESVPDYKDNMVPLMSRLEQDGKWQKVTWETYSNHFLRNKGQLMVFQKC